MHTAFHAYVVLEKLPLKLECIEAYKSILLVGTAEGVVVVVDVKQATAKEPFSSRIVATHKNFGKKPIEQLAAIEDLDLLLALSDGVISIHELSSGSFRAQMAKTKGANLFAVDVQKSEGKPPVVRLCVSARRKLIMFEWANNDFVEVKVRSLLRLAT